MDDRISSKHVAHELIEVIPLVMQELRAEVRRQRGSDLSVLQIRVLAFLNRHPGSPLSAVADHVGLTLPSTSSQVAGLVGKGLVHRSVSSEDRRYVTLTVTEQGHQVLEAALLAAEKSMDRILSTLSADERRLLSDALSLLRQLFSSPSTQGPS